MKFLLIEILFSLIAASILGLIIGWALKAVFARRKLAQMDSSWNTKYSALKISSSREISELEETMEAFESNKTKLETKVASLSAMVKSMESAISKADSENKTLNATISSQQQTINEIRMESENLIKQQSAMQLELNALEKAKDQEFQALKRQFDSTLGPLPAGQHTGRYSLDSGTQGPNDPLDITAGTYRNLENIEPSNAPEQRAAYEARARSSTGVTESYLAPVLNKPDQSDSTDIDQKIKQLNAQRDRLNREREELFNQEQRFAAQLTRGDDTEAYLDQTVRLDEDLTTTIQSDTSELHRAASEPAEAPADADPSLETEPAAATPQIKSPERPKSLWDKFKSTVSSD